MPVMLWHQNSLKTNAFIVEMFGVLFLVRAAAPVILSILLLLRPLLLLLRHLRRLRCCLPPPAPPVLPVHFMTCIPLLNVQAISLYQLHRIVR